MNPFHDNLTLGEAREMLRVLLQEGQAITCPTCTQFAKVYKRQIHASMARALILLYQRSDPDGWGHFPTILDGRRADEGKLAYWSLIEEATERREDGGRAGWWRITDQGRAFVQRRLEVPKYARVYDGRLLGFEGDPVRITDCIGDKFNYQELMDG